MSLGTDRVVVTHPEWGIYLGNFWGLGFWSLLDGAGQPAAVTMASEEAAKSHVSDWAENNDPGTYAYVTVTCSDGEYATPAELARAGLERLLGELSVN
tara:strand:+ start:1230 stop:1523 length:294 start_codon:yes stop_codon:yes gene_type:complete